MMSRKGFTQFTFIIVFFAIIGMMSIFTFVFIYEIGRTEILEPIHNITIFVEQSANVSAQMQTFTDDTFQAYEDLDIPYDIYFLAIWMSVIISSLKLALSTRKMNPFQFLGMVFWGLMGLLLVVFFVEQITSWFFDNFFYAIFNDITVEIPITDFFFDNLGIISAIWFLILLAVNQLEFSFSRGRVEA